MSVHTKSFFHFVKNAYKHKELYLHSNIHLHVVLNYVQNPIKMVHCTLHVQTHCKTLKTMTGVMQALTQAVSHHLHSAKAKVQSQIYGGQSNTVTRFYSNMSVSPVNITPPTLHTHLFISHLHCIVVAVDSVVKQHSQQTF